MAVLNPQPRKPSSIRLHAHHNYYVYDIKVFHSGYPGSFNMGLLASRTAGPNNAPDNA